jgi:hypothetical protein
MSASYILQEYSAIGEEILCGNQSVIVCATYNNWMSNYQRWHCFTHKPKAEDPKTNKQVNHSNHVD